MRRMIAELKQTPDVGVAVRTYYDSTSGEYVCRVIVQGVSAPESDYFTDDRSDAQSTAAEMLKQAVSKYMGVV